MPNHPDENSNVPVKMRHALIIHKTLSQVEREYENRQIQKPDDNNIEKPNDNPENKKTVSLPKPKVAKPADFKAHLPPHILEAFHKAIPEKLLGATYENPYEEDEAKRIQTFPAKREQFKAVHLHILTRNEAVNVTGESDFTFYNSDIFTPETIINLRTLVKFSSIAGVIYPKAYGKPPSAFEGEPPKTILIDQAGFQWQDDYRNTGGLFFYPDNEVNNGLPPNYNQWQKDAFKACYGFERPYKPDLKGPNPNMIPVLWSNRTKKKDNVQGLLDLSGLAMGIEQEYMQAFEAAVVQSKQLLPDEKVNFKYLKAGIGFFADRLYNPDGSPLDKTKLEIARLQGIKRAIKKIKERVNKDPSKSGDYLGKIASFELPYSQSKNPIITDLLKTIAQDVSEIQLTPAIHGKPATYMNWAGAAENDAYSLRTHSEYIDENGKTITVVYVNATTNCADVLAGPGNEGGVGSVDALMSHNADTSNAYPLKNPDIQEYALTYCSGATEADYNAYAAEDFLKGYKRVFTREENMLMTYLKSLPEQAKFQGKIPHQTSTEDSQSQLAMSTVTVERQKPPDSSIKMTIAQGSQQFSYKLILDSENRLMVYQDGIPPSPNARALHWKNIFYAMGIPSESKEIYNLTLFLREKLILPEEIAKLPVHLQIEAQNREIKKSEKNIQLGAIQAYINAHANQLKPSHIVILSALLRDLSTYNPNSRKFNKTSQLDTFNRCLKPQDNIIINTVAFSPDEMDRLLTKVLPQPDQPYNIENLKKFLEKNSKLNEQFGRAPFKDMNAPNISSQETEKVEVDFNKSMRTLLDELIIGVSGRRINNLDWTRNKLDALKERRDMLERFDPKIKVTHKDKMHFLFMLYHDCALKDGVGAMNFFVRETQSMKQFKLFLKTNQKALGINEKDIKNIPKYQKTYSSETQAESSSQSQQDDIKPPRP